MRILLVNDDGIQAEGIRTLAKVLGKEHEVYVVAPASQRSAFSHSVTYFYKKNRAERRNVENAAEAWAVEGTPADCTYYALNGLLKQNIDLVISGINHGPNMSSDTIYSGTVGAAREGMINKIPSIAVSLAANKGTHFETAARVVLHTIEQFAEDDNNLEYVLNINVPDVPYEELKGARVTEFSGGIEYQRGVVMEESEGGYLLSIEQSGINPYADAETSSPYADTRAVQEGYVSFTPLYNDIVHHDLLPVMKTYEQLISDRN